MSVLVLSALLDLLFLVWILPSVYGLSTALLRFPEFWSSTISLIASLAMLELARRGKVELAARIFVAFAFVATWSILYSKLATTGDEREASRVLALLLLSQMFGGLLLDFRQTMVLACGHLLGLATLPLVMQHLDLARIVGMGVLFGFSVLLSATTALLHHLDLAEILGSRRSLEESVRELRRQIQARELAERTKSDLEDALLRTQRMEAVARLAGGFAHDFNNVLMSVLGQLERIRPSAGREDAPRIDNAIRSVEIASGLIKGMLAFGRPRERIMQGKPSDLVSLVEEGTALARAAIPRGIEIDCRTEPGIWALADPAQVVQVLVNLCVNARDALESGTFDGFRPCIRIATGRASPEEIGTVGLDGRTEGYAWIQVEDNGPGIPPEVRERIFDPFFTTKPVGKGTGLGLWMCDSILRGLGGLIQLRTPEASANGTAFRIFLPACAPSDSRFEPAIVPQAPASGFGEGNVLLVDDDESIRDNLASALSEGGWNVVQAYDGQEALRLFDAAPDSFRLVVLDLSLPGVPGREVFQSARKRRPDLPILVITGFDVEAGDASPVVDGANGRLLKPFRARTFLREVERIANGSDSTQVSESTEIVTRKY